MRKAISALFALSVVATSSAAFAQYGGQYSSGTYQTTMPQRSSEIDNLGNEGQIVIGVDRTMGIFFNRVKSELDVAGTTVTRTTKNTTVALFGLDGSYTSIPRLALDYFVTEGISIGGSFVFISSSGETESDAGGTSTTTDDPSTRTIAFAPRVGYAYPFDETFSIWPRAGITYFNSETEDTTPGGVGTPSVTTTTTTSGLDLTLEAMLGISPFSNFAFLVGPYLDLGLSGDTTVEDDQPGSTSQEADTTVTSYGLAVSLVGYF